MFTLRYESFLGFRAGRVNRPAWRAEAGAVLFTVLILTFATIVVSAAVLNNALNSFRLSQRNDMRARMTAVADSELEWMYYNVTTAGKFGVVMSNIGSDSRISDNADVGDTPIVIRDAYLGLHKAKGWRVQRSVRHLLTTRGVDSSNGGSRRAILDYVEVKIIVLPPESGQFATLSPVKIGRYFVASQSTIFQYGVFFEGDLEINPGESYSIDGDIYASGNAYMAPVTGKTLTVASSAKLRLTNGKTLNGSLDKEVAGTTYYNPNAPVVGQTFANPFFALTGAGKPGNQLERLNAPENLLGGLDALATAESRPDLFGPAGQGNASSFPPGDWSPAERAEAINNVNRSLIAPPPNVSNVSEYPNNPATDLDSINVQRAYSRAGLIVTVSSSGAVTIQQRASNGSLSDVTGIYQTSSSGSPAIASSAPLSVYDQREGMNIKVTELDVQALKTKLSVNPDFNGLIYFNLKNSSSAAPAAVRLINGENVPVTATGSGLSVATNGGLYVKGSFNTTPGASGRFPSSMLMADAVTVLSYAWNDSGASDSILTGRVASVDNLATGTVETSLTINAGIATGNSVSTHSNSSGGAQNLVRYLENWSNKVVNLNGSLGRLFNSKQFTRPFIGTNNVYRAPLRSIVYDGGLANSPPPGSPVLTTFSRGDIFQF